MMVVQLFTHAKPLGSVALSYLSHPDEIEKRRVFQGAPRGGIFDRQTHPYRE